MQTDDFDFDAFVNRSTVHDGLPVDVSGNFASEEDAKTLLNSVMAFAKIFGSVFDLSALAGITVADDYVAALAAVDRGYPGMSAPTPTRDSFGAGFAMAVPVLRDGVHKCHVVLDAALARPLIDAKHEYYGLAVHTFCHEMAHVYDHMLRAKAMPGHYGSPITDLQEVVLMQFAMAAWDEYAASRLSAHWGMEDYCRTHEDSLVKMLQSILLRGEDAKKEFSTHRDVQKTMVELRGVYETFFVRASYLIGHIDGLERTLQEEAPALAAALGKTQWLYPLWIRYTAILQSMFNELESWQGVEAYSEMKELGQELLLKGGMGFVKLPSGSYYVGFNPTVSL